MYSNNDSKLKALNNDEKRISVYIQFQKKNSKIFKLVLEELSSIEIFLFSKRTPTFHKLNLLNPNTH